MVTTVRIDAQGRLVVPQHLRDGLVDLPGEVTIEMLDGGLLIRPVRPTSRVVVADDGLPLLVTDEFVGHEDLLSAIHAERDGR